MIDTNAMPLYMKVIASRDGEYSMSETEVTTMNSDPVAEALDNAVVAVRQRALSTSGAEFKQAVKFIDKVEALKSAWVDGPKAGGAKRGRKPKVVEPVAEAAE